MKTKRIFSKIVTSICICCLMTSNVYASDETLVKNSTIEEFQTPSISPRADQIGWRYMAINGILHKRQYNYTRDIWLGKWVPA